MTGWCDQEVLRDEVRGGTQLFLQALSGSTDLGRTRAADWKRQFLTGKELGVQGIV